MATDSTTVIKRHVIRGADVKRSPAGLYVNTYEGEMWATNRYWVTRAERVAPLLEKFNLPAGEPGVYEVNGSVRRANGDNHGISPQPPEVGKVIAKAQGFEPGIRVRVAGFPVLAPYNGDYLALFLLMDGSHAGLFADELDWLSDLSTAPLPGLKPQEDGTYLRYGDVRVLFHRNAYGLPCAMIQAQVFRVLKRGYYDNEERCSIPAVEEPAEPRVIAMTMGVKIDA